ncbi:SAM-dependent methyltransferase [Streptomyces sp. ISL-98]|uniref:SAM-dependent methyltransferase n=1 Tax=Streptomyces sp. ISL-98 TaxID=2819192 RepID=UPI001BE6DF22|nr:SAM-dependent methyltransferase [Streptomyces sp. ISL-98]MBT2509631.1 SAM-dependent methyltransferase [Streptomyces sp. ISL-98]
MTPTLVQHHPNTASAPAADAGARARDWAEIQERMLVPLYESVYERLEVGPDTRLLGLGCGSGLALLIAAARGARVTGVEADTERVALARERLLPDAAARGGASGGGPEASRRLFAGATAAVCEPSAPAYNLVTAFEPLGCAAGDSEGIASALEGAVPLAERGSPVVIAGWGPPERCATSSVLRVASRLTETLRAPHSGRWRPALRDDLEDVASRAGLKPDGSGRVSCPFGYADMESAVRGLLSTGLFDSAVRATDPAQVEKELTEALHPHLRSDGTVWMSNVFRYLIARTP